MGFTTPCAHQQSISLTDTVSRSHVLGQTFCTGSQTSQEHEASAVIQVVLL